MNASRARRNVGGKKDRGREHALNLPLHVASAGREEEEEEERWQSGVIRSYVVDQPPRCRPDYRRNKPITFGPSLSLYTARRDLSPPQAETRFRFSTSPLFF